MGKLPTGPGPTPRPTSMPMPERRPGPGWTRTRKSNNRPRPKTPMRKVPGRTRNIPEIIHDVQFNCLLVNCRSLKNKLPSLITNFKENKTSVAVLTETWFQRRDNQLKAQLDEIGLRDEISFIRRDRDSRGGGA